MGISIIFIYSLYVEIQYSKYYSLIINLLNYLRRTLDLNLGNHQRERGRRKRRRLKRIMYLLIGQLNNMIKFRSKFLYRISIYVFSQLAVTSMFDSYGCCVVNVGCGSSTKKVSCRCGCGALTNEILPITGFMCGCLVMALDAAVENWQLRCLRITGYKYGWRAMVLDADTVTGS